MAISQSFRSRIRRFKWRLILITAVIVAAQFGSEDASERYLAKNSAILGFALGIMCVYVVNDTLNSIDVRYPDVLKGADFTSADYYTTRKQARMDACLTGVLILFMNAIWHFYGNLLPTAEWPFLLSICPMLYVSARNAWWWHKAGSR